MGFDILSLQKGRGPVQARSKADEGRTVLKYIDVDDLVPNEDNFYSMSAIEELATLIELSGGVKQPALVVPLGGGKYKVISGHRRRLASILLVKQGKEEYRKMPCMVDADAREPGADADELRAIDEAILLITTNGQREKTDWDKVQEATRLRALLERKRRFEKIPGETRKLIAEQLGTTPAQVGRYDSIEKHLIPAFKVWLESGRIGISVAYELSTLPEDVQNKAADETWVKNRPVTLEDVRKWKQEAEEVAPQPPPPDLPAYGSGVSVREVKTNITAPPWPPADGDAEENTEPEQTAGKVVDFPAPSSPPPAPTAEKKRQADEEWAALMLGDLRNYCETMALARLIFSRYRDKYSWARIAVQNGVPDRTVRWWHDKAVDRMSEAMEEAPMMDELLGRASRARD